MKFASIEGQRREAQPGLSGTCASCRETVVAKCGKLRVGHWAHKGVRVCDRWWESETEWHRNWKNEFPANWQEVVQIAPNGEKHVADIRTENGIVIEFQHSFLKAEERIARELYYRKMLWVVDGRRRKRDAAQLLECIGPRIWSQPPFIIHSARGDACALLRDWNSSSMPVYFDLGPHEQDGEPTLWRRDPISRTGTVYLTPVSRDSFLRVHRTGLDAEERFSEGVGVIVENFQRVTNQPHLAPTFQRYPTARRRLRRF
jgi:hypothetical protein